MGDEFIYEIKNNDELKVFMEESEDKMYLIDFYANWCRPCKDFGNMIKKNKKKLLDKYDNLRILKVNVDNKRINVDMFEITGIPRFIIIKNKKILVDECGNYPLNELIILIEKALKN